MGNVIFGLMFVGVFVGAIANEMRKRKQRKDTLVVLAPALRGFVIANEVFGRCNGAAICFRYATRGSGSDIERWTEIDVDVPWGYPFTLNLRRHQWTDRRRIESGDLIDVAVGNRRFDDEFLVEGAPADVLRQFFDPALRRLLLETRHAVELTTHRAGDRAFVRFATRCWVHEPDAAYALVEGVAQIPTRLRAAYAEADRKIPVAFDGGPYRPAPSSQPDHDVAEARAYEVERLLALRAQRDASAGGFTVGLVFALLALGLFALASAH
jgi:hypothetical protein